MNKLQKFSGIKTKKIVLEHNLLKAALWVAFFVINTLQKYQYSLTRKISSRQLITEISHSIAHHFYYVTPLFHFYTPKHGLLRDNIEAAIITKQIKTTLSFYMCLHPQNILTQQYYCFFFSLEKNKDNHRYSQTTKEKIRLSFRLYLN